jgi:hypothetical protein
MGSTVVAPERAAASPVTDEELEQTFAELAVRWRTETRYKSWVADMVRHPAYQQIIAMGPPVVPLILRELERKPDHWFWALTAITGDNPIREEDRGRVDRMTEAWLEYGRERGHL